MDVESSSFPQDYTANERQSLDVDSGFLAHHLMLFPGLLLKFFHRRFNEMIHFTFLVVGNMSYSAVSPASGEPRSSVEVRAPACMGSEIELAERDSV